MESLSGTVFRGWEPLALPGTQRLPPGHRQRRATPGLRGTAWAHVRHTPDHLAEPGVFTRSGERQPPPSLASPRAGASRFGRNGSGGREVTGDTSVKKADVQHHKVNAGCRPPKSIRYCTEGGGDTRRVFSPLSTKDGSPSSSGGKSLIQVAPSSDETAHSPPGRGADLTCPEEGRNADEE
ncbi:hypothetical protein HPB51_025379 [Rhipicephalus microplus]|uniref:Uncharacterized protein n=1 Tax=Rhipicephalus microplus TaxID=6941 RepID=A0A9J6DDW9_RHIMP|nr:hypothetical protein HPB51_025379 [Rhipicephalus microplus]